MVSSIRICLSTSYPYRLSDARFDKNLNRPAGRKASNPVSVSWSCVVFGMLVATLLALMKRTTSSCLRYHTKSSQDSRGLELAHQDRITTFPYTVRNTCGCRAITRRRVATIIVSSTSSTLKQSHTKTRSRFNSHGARQRGAPDATSPLRIQHHAATKQAFFLQENFPRCLSCVRDEQERSHRSRGPPAAQPVNCAQRHCPRRRCGLYRQREFTMCPPSTNSVKKKQVG